MLSIVLETISKDEVVVVDDPRGMAVGMGCFKDYRRRVQCGPTLLTKKALQAQLQS
jgi:hypothetical protein